MASKRKRPTTSAVHLLDNIYISRRNEATEDSIAVPWSLKRGEQVIFTLPRAAVVRMHINHLIHHRGQLSVYLRLNDVPLPSIYGPTADEPW